MKEANRLSVLTCHIILNADVLEGAVEGWGSPGGGRREVGVKSF